CVDRGRAVQARDARAFPGARQSRTDRRVPCLSRPTALLHLLGLSGRCLAEEPGLAHRSLAVVAAGRRPAAIMRDRRRAARLGEAVGSRPDLYRTECLANELPGDAHAGLAADAVGAQGWFGCAPKPTESPIGAGVGVAAAGGVGFAAEGSERAPSGAWMTMRSSGPCASA